MMQSLTQWMENAKTMVDDWIHRDIEAMASEPGSVEEAMSYSLLNGGKRLRPLLVLAAGEYLGIAWQNLMDVALAVEYVHTYSLIHDDLPAMDNDDYRRGHLTAHKVFGEARAILAGDALLTEAFAKMSSIDAALFPAQGVVDATQALAQACGRRGLVRGQVRDLAAEHTVITLEALQAIHAQKTAALFQASLRIPALLKGDRQSDQEFEQFGLHFGLAFQIVDDILNVVGDPNKMGKATGTDALLEKATYPRLLGMDEAHSLMMHHVEQAKRVLSGERSPLLIDLLEFAVRRTW